MSTPVTSIDERLADLETMTYKERVARYRSVQCPLPRCRASVGEDCRTPNGWPAHHVARERVARGELPAPAKPRKHRLTEAQAERIERAAQHGQYYAAGQYAQFGGDAAERAVADGLERRGLIAETARADDGERRFELTAAGWRAYWHDPKVIRRLPEDQHAARCPCGVSS